MAFDAQGRQLMTDTGVDLVKSVPPAALAFWQLLGSELDVVAKVVSIVWVLILIGQFVYRSLKKKNDP